MDPNLLLIMEVITGKIEDIMMSLGDDYEIRQVIV
jgi:hypothetical protein